MTDLSDIHQCCAKEFNDILTTSRCPSLSLHFTSLLFAVAGCPFLVLCFVGQCFPFLAFEVDSQVQSLSYSFVEISPRF